MHSHVAEELLSNLQSKVDICENGSAHHLLNMPHITPHQNPCSVPTMGSGLILSSFCLFVLISAVKYGSMLIILQWQFNSWILIST